MDLNYHFKSLLALKTMSTVLFPISDSLDFNIILT